MKNNSEFMIFRTTRKLMKIQFIIFGEEIKLYNFTMSLKMFSKWSKNSGLTGTGVQHHKIAMKLWMYVWKFYLHVMRVKATHRSKHTNSDTQIQSNTHIQTFAVRLPHCCQNCNANSSTHKFSCGPPKNYGHLIDS